MESELERLRDRLRELEVANEALRQSERELATEQEILQQVATRLITAPGTEALFEQVLDTAMAIMHSDFASIQMFYPGRGNNGELKLLGHRGFSPQAAKRWEWVCHSTRTTCGEALRTSRKVVVPDVRKCDFMAGSEDLDGYLEGGISAGQTVRLVSRSGVLRGMVSTYWREPHELSIGELRSMDILARLAADLIEQKQIEERLRASETRLINAQHLAKLGSWERDEVTGNTEFSDEMIRILGMPDHPPLTLSDFLNFVYPEDRDYVWAGAQRARSTGSLVEGEYRIIRADGQVRFVHSILEAIRNDTGDVIRVVGATQDITDLKRAQEESAARQKLESVGTLARGIAHDFNNLLGGVLAQSELALAELDAGLHPKTELAMIRDVALRGSEIVRQLMIYAGNESGTVGPVHLSRIVEEMIELLKVSVSKHADLEIDFAKDLPPVRADAAQIRQIVMNLITNASEAIGKRDGVIRVSTSYVRVDRGSSPAISGAVVDGDYLQLLVSDTGCGMSPETQAQVLNPFFTTKPAGHGLGLAVVDGIVRSLGGAICIRSELGKGTTFQILLPCAETTDRATSDAMSAIEESAKPSNQPTFLIVEDEDVLRHGVAKMLRMSGFCVLEAADGSSAIDLLRAAADKIDMMLLDMTIPGASSAEVVAEAARARPDIRVILTSAYSQEMMSAPLSAPQVLAFIQKPFQIGDLVQMLRRNSSSSR